MLWREAKWFATEMRMLADTQLYPMLNIGSHTKEFRKREQPWIDRYLFAPARDKGLSVVHSDLQSLPGVDLVGDLLDPVFLAKIAAMRFRSVFCANLLEHVTNREEIAAVLVKAVEPGGLILVSCPNVFPYHPDPIDTMYRPPPAELASLFPGTTIVKAERVRCGNLSTYIFRRFATDPGMLWRMLFRRRAQVVRKTEAGLSAQQWLPWLWRPFFQACVILRKDTGTP